MTSATINNDQASLALNEDFVLSGQFPSTSGASDENLIGMIRTFAFSSAIDASGVAPAQGQTVPISGSTAPFSVIGTLYGGDGALNFNLPNLSGAVAVGTSSSPGGFTGQDTTVLTSSQLPPLLGGSSQPINNEQPSLSVEYLIRVNGIFPSSTSLPNNGFIGEIIPFAGNIVPSGFMLAAGQTLNIQQNIALFSIIGTLYGGNGTTNFQLPNLNNRNIIGASSATPLGTVVGQQNITLTNANVSSADGGGGQPVDNRAPGLALNYIIATQGVFPTAGAALSAQQYVGEVRAFAGVASAIPAGWALANGAQLPISSNQALFQLIGTTYGGDGQQFFALPNLQDHVVVGAGPSDPPGAAFGQNSVTLPPGTPCFCAGCSVLTERGEVAVEALRIGDVVVTASGRLRPIKWIGMRAYSARFARNNADAHPVCFKAGSLADGVPRRDLRVSPRHAMLLDGVLVPAEALVNGITITQPLPTEEVRYYHVELDSHDVLVVDGAAAESFLDDNSRGLFQNAASYGALYAGEAPRETLFCAPRVESGERLERVRRRLEARAASKRLAG